MVMDRSEKMRFRVENLFSLENKVVLITGAGGLGGIYARAFAENGARVILASKTLQKALKVRDQLAESGLSCAVHPLNVADKRQVNRLAAEIEQTYGTIDVLVHTAALCKLHPVMEDCEELFRMNCDVNIMGSVFVNQAVGSLMARHGGGSIININSQSAFTVNSPDGMSYGVSKAALMQITKWFAVALADQGVTVNGIAPIWIQTPMLAGRPKDYFVQAVKQVPMGRISTPEDYVGMALFLAGGGSRYITGQTFLVDGGLSVSRVFKFRQRDEAAEAE